MAASGNNYENEELKALFGNAAIVIGYLAADDPVRKFEIFESAEHWNELNAGFRTYAARLNEAYNDGEIDQEKLDRRQHENIENATQAWALLVLPFLFSEFWPHKQRMLQDALGLAAPNFIERGDK